MIKFAALVIIVMILVVLGFFLYPKVLNLTSPTQPSVKLKTYFNYSAQELESLKNLKSKANLAVNQIEEWDEKAFKLVADTKTVGPAKFYAYLAVGQADAAFITYNLTQKYALDISPLSKAVFCKFYPENCADFEIENNDEYSQRVAEIVTKKIKDRIAEDNENTSDYPIKSGEQYWNGADPKIGIDAGTSKPWLIKSADQFRALPPPEPDSDEMKQQLIQVQEALKNITKEQREAVIKWAGGPGTKTPPGQWLEIADQFMLEKKISLQKYLEARAVLMMTIADADSAVFDSKYIYFVKRPFMMDETIVTIMPTPNHPSYPAGHSTLSSAASTVLTYYFPENTKEWTRLAEEAGNSRLWGGIHFDIDNQAGFILGKKVAEEALKNIPFN